MPALYEATVGPRFWSSQATMLAMNDDSGTSGSSCFFCCGADDTSQSTMSDVVPCFPYCHREWEDPCCEVTLAWNSFRGIPDGSWQGNTGVFARANFAMPFSEPIAGLGFQLGGSYGIYQWSGRGTGLSCESENFEQQAFVTIGLFREAADCCGLNLGFVYDAMFNRNFGLFSASPILGQVRAQAAWAFCQGHELGFWGTVSTRTSHVMSDQIPLEFRAIDQINLMWRYRWGSCGEAMAWIGTPWGRSLMFCSGTPGRLIFGFFLRAPLTDSLYLEGLGSYMSGRGCDRTERARNYAANACIGLTYYFGGCGSKHPAYMAVGNNSNFLVDTNLTQ